MMFPRIARLIVGITGTILILIGIILGLLWFAPLGSLSPESDPAQDFETALAKIEMVQSRDTEDFNPVCHSYALTHDEPTEKAFALIHGMSNCPEQWRIFANMLFEAGHNVYVPRMPHNGYADRLDVRATDIFAENLAQFAEETADILVGLGEETTIAGLSAGGSVTSWVALNRDDVDRSVIMAPSLLPYNIPDLFGRPFVNFIRILPNQEFWWDSELKEDIPGPPYAAPLIFSREAAEQFRFGLILSDLAREKPPETRVLFLTASLDDAVNQETIGNMREAMLANGGDVEQYEFSADLGVSHDYIDPNQLDANIEAVYPVLFELLTGDTFGGEIVMPEDADGSSDQ